MPFAHPVGQTVREDWNDFAADSANPPPRVSEQGDRDLSDPIGLNDNIVVGENDDITARLRDRPIPRVVEALLSFEQVTWCRMDAGKTLDRRACVVRRVVIDDEHLEVVARKLLGCYAGQR